MRKPESCICECKNKDADQLHSNRKADQRLCFSYTVQFLYFPYTKFRTTSHLLWLYILAWSETPKTGFLTTRLIFYPQKNKFCKNCNMYNNMLQSLDMEIVISHNIITVHQRIIILNIFYTVLYELRHEKTRILHTQKKDADQLHSNRKADQRLCFSYTVQSLYFPYTQFQTTIHLLWLYILACVQPGQKPRKPVFSQRGSYSIPRKTNSAKTAICTTTCYKVLTWKLSFNTIL